MLARIGFVTLTLICGISVGKEFLPNQSDVRFLSIRYSDEGEKTKVLAQHTLRLGKAGMIDFTADGKTNPHDEDSTIRFGTQINGKLTSLENDSHTASISLKLGAPVNCDAPATQIVRSECLELRTVLKTGIESKIHCGGNRWLILRIDN